MINAGRIVAAGSPSDIMTSSCPSRPDADLNDPFIALMAGESTKRSNVYTD
ncbi:MAG: hypothetical protein JW943_09030 [Deltaproteobacteria bacterium]|nr:hypothetical protein [Deltaproteobacteria bacterium]